jgi:hypothetical protein
VTWFKVDDAFALHPKVLAAGHAAIGLWCRAGSWCAQQLTDGHVPTAMVAVLGGKPADVAALVSTGLWLEVEDGWLFHEWDRWQPTRAQVEAQRADRQKGADRGNHVRWHVQRGVIDPDCRWCQEDK